MAGGDRADRVGADHSDALAAAVEAHKSERYLTEQFRRLGLTPAGVRGYLQPVQVRVQRVLDHRSSAALADGREETALALGSELVLSNGAVQPLRIDAPLVFLGPRERPAAADLRGRVVVLLDDGGADQAAARRLAERAGAVGVVAIPTSPAGWEARRAEFSRVSYSLADARPDAFLVAAIEPGAAEKLFARSGRSLADAVAAARRGDRTPGFALNLSLRARIVAETHRRTAANVLGVLPGTDPLLAREHIVVSAHLDGGGETDAHGAATVLEAARLMQATGVRPKRSVLFAVFAGADGAPLGSAAFTAHPTVSRGSLAANVDLDRAAPGAATTAEGGEESSLGRDARAVAIALDFPVATTAYEGGAFHGFVRAGVPSLLVKLGASPDGDAASRFGAYLHALTRRIADQDAQPSWLPGSAFAPPAPRAEHILTVPLEMPVGRRPQKASPNYG